MVNVLIRGVSADVHVALTGKAEREGLSLQQFLSRELERLAERPTMAEWVAMVESRLPLSSRTTEPFDAAAYLRDEQEERARRMAGVDAGEGEQD